MKNITAIITWIFDTELQLFLIPGDIGHEWIYADRESAGLSGNNIQAAIHALLFEFNGFKVNLFEDSEGMKK